MTVLPSGWLHSQLPLTPKGYLDTYALPGFPLKSSIWVAHPSPHFMAALMHPYACCALQVCMGITVATVTDSELVRNVWGIVVRFYYSHSD